MLLQEANSSRLQIQSHSGVADSLVPAGRQENGCSCRKFVELARFDMSNGRIPAVSLVKPGVFGILKARCGAQSLPRLPNVVG